MNMLTAPIMYDCLRRLLNSNDEDSLECLCKLLITIGKELDATSTTKGSQVRPLLQVFLRSAFSSAGWGGYCGEVTRNVVF